MHVVDIAGADAHRSPILVGAVGDGVVGDVFVMTDLTRIGWIIGQMGFETGIGIDAELQPGAADVAEETLSGAVVVGAAEEVETGRSQMGKGAAAENEVIGIGYLHRGGGPADPGLVLQTLFIGRAGGLELVS